MSKDVLVPDVGGEEVEVIEVCVAVGDTVEAEDALVTVESDKASMDIPAPFGGKVTEVLVAVGDKVGQDKLIMKIEEAGATVVEAEVASVAPTEPAEAAAQAAHAATAHEPAPAAEPVASTVVEVTVPDIGDASDVDVIELLVAEGDSVEAEDGLITLETDKATMDVPAPQAGVVKALKINVGDKVSQGSLVLLLEVSSGAAADEAPAASVSAAPETTTAPVPEALPAAASAPSLMQVDVPDIGDASDVDVIELLVSVGDSVEAEDGLITLETDKATMDVPAPKAGVVKEMLVKVGDKVSKGSAVIMLEVAGEAAPVPAPVPAPAAAASAPAAVSAPAPKAPPVPHHPSAGEIPKTGIVHASPSIRRLAREFGVDLSQVKGTGRKGRVLKEDVQSYVKYELSRPKAHASSAVAPTQHSDGVLHVLPQPKVDFSKFGEIEEKPLTRIQKISGPNLHRNWVTIPHVTQFEDADITDVEAFRKEQNALNAKMKLDVKITPLVFIMKAAASALLAYPQFNSSLSETGESLILKKYVHIGIAVDTPNGLVVPVIRDVDKKGVIEISKELMEISKKARDGKLKATDMQGGCFSISSLGGIGGTAFTPIVNAPEVAILGVSKSEMKPKWNGSEFVPRLTLPLSLSYDHRVIDGALAARFAVHLSGVLGDIRRLVM